MRFLLLSALATLALTPTLTAEDKKADPIDAELLLGRWEPKEKKEGVSLVLEFKPDGKAALSVTEGENGNNRVRTYTVNGAEVTLTMTVDGKEQTLERTITKLTADEFVTKDDKGTERTFVKVKDKK